MTSSQPPYDAPENPPRLTAGEAIRLLDAKFPNASHAGLARIVGIDPVTIGDWRRHPGRVLHAAKSDAVRKAVTS